MEDQTNNVAKCLVYIPKNAAVQWSFLNLSKPRWDDLTGGSTSVVLHARLDARSKELLGFTEDADPTFEMNCQAHRHRYRIPARRLYRLLRIHGGDELTFRPTAAGGNATDKVELDMTVKWATKTGEPHPAAYDWQGVQLRR